MPRSDGTPSVESTANREGGCAHGYPSVVFSEMGCYAHCLKCGFRGPMEASFEAARQALVLMGVDGQLARR